MVAPSHLRTVEVRGENIRIDDILPSGVSVRHIEFDSNTHRTINGVVYPNEARVVIKREVSSKGMFGNENAKGKTRVNWDDRIEDLQWLIESGTSIGAALERAAPEVGLTTWRQRLQGDEFKNVRAYIYQVLSQTQSQ